MNGSEVPYRRVNVINEKASFGIIQFDEYEHKQDFKQCLATNGKEVKKKTGLRFGNNVDKDANNREKAVGKVKLALMQAKENREDVYRSYTKGLVWVGDDLVAKWDDMSKVMMFDGEGKVIRDTYKKLMAEKKGDAGDFSE